MIEFKDLLKRTTSLLFLIPIYSVLLTELAVAKSGIVINKNEVIINVSEGAPTLKAKIGNETYNFLVTPSDLGINISPQIAAKYQLDRNASTGKTVRLDHAILAFQKNKLEIEFLGFKAKKYDVNWLSSPPYVGVDGTVGLAVFKGRKVTFIFDDEIPLEKMKVKSHRNNTLHDGNWRKNLQLFAGTENIELAFRPHYDVTRMTIGASYAFDKDENLSFTGESYLMPREFRGYKEFALGEFKTPISPLKGIKPLSSAEVHVIEGFFDEVVTGEDEVVAVGKSTRRYTPILWLGRDYFDGCHKIVFSGTGNNLKTYCPN